VPIYRVGTNIYATHLFHQGTRHGYTGGSRNTAGYGQLESRRIAQPSQILAIKPASPSRFPDSWWLEVAPPPPPPPPLEVIVAQNFPMAYILDVSAKELTSKVSEEAVIKRIAQTFPHQILKFGKQQELISVWGIIELSSEEWLHNNHWDCGNEVEISVAGDPGKQNLGTAVPAGKVRRIRVFKIRNAGTNNIVVTVMVGTDSKLTIDVPAQTTRVYFEIHGIKLTETQQPTVQSDSVTGGNVFVRASGVEV
jgi:hypothetical protein